MARGKINKRIAENRPYTQEEWELFSTRQQRDRVDKAPFLVINVNLIKSHKDRLINLLQYNIKQGKDVVESQRAILQLQTRGSQQEAGPSTPQQKTYFEYDREITQEEYDQLNSNLNLDGTPKSAKQKSHDKRITKRIREKYAKDPDKYEDFYYDLEFVIRTKTKSWPNIPMGPNETYLKEAIRSSTNILDTQYKIDRIVRHVYRHLDLEGQTEQQIQRKRETIDMVINYIRPQAIGVDQFGNPVTTLLQRPQEEYERLEAVENFYDDSIRTYTVTITPRRQTQPTTVTEHVLRISPDRFRREIKRSIVKGLADREQMGKSNDNIEVVLRLAYRETGDYQEMFNDIKWRNVFSGPEIHDPSERITPAILSEFIDSPEFAAMTNDLDSETPLELNVDTRLARYEAFKDKVYVLDRTRFEISFLPIPAGQGEPDTPEQSMSNSYKLVNSIPFHCHSYPGKKDCFVRCIKYFQGYSESVAQLKRKYNLPTDGTVNVNNIKVYADIFKININVYAPCEFKSVKVTYNKLVEPATSPYHIEATLDWRSKMLLATTGDDYTKTMGVVLKDNHYILIIKTLSLEHICFHCGRLKDGHGNNICRGVDSCRRFLIKVKDENGNPLITPTGRSYPKSDKEVQMLYLTMSHTVTEDNYIVEMKEAVYNRERYTKGCDFLSSTEKFTSVEDLNAELFSEYENARRYCITYGGSKLEYYHLLKDYFMNYSTADITRKLVVANRILQFNCRGTSLWDLREHINIDYNDLPKYFPELRRSLNDPFKKGRILTKESDILRIMMKKYHNVITLMFGEDVNVLNYPTMTSFIMSQFKQSKPSDYFTSFYPEEFQLKNFKKDAGEDVDEDEVNEQHAANVSYYDDFVRKAMVGGRVHAESGVYQGNYTMFDVNSLYPHAMLSGYYPVGYPREVDHFVNYHMGIYECVVDQRPLIKIGKPMIVPTRTVKGTLDWSSEPWKDNPLTVTITNVEIMLLYEMGCPYTVVKGLVWESYKGSDLFSIVDGIMDFKNNPGKFNQDDRELGKYIAKASSVMLTGKLNARNYTYSTEIISTNHTSDYQRFVSTHNIRDFKPLNDNYAIITGQTRVPKFNQYIHVGVFIYAWARYHMYKHVYNVFDTVLYSDTDSALVSFSEAPKLAGMQDETLCGKFKIEMMNISKAIIIGKKSYYLQGFKPDNMLATPKERFRMAGVPVDCPYWVFDDANPDHAQYIQAIDFKELPVLDTLQVNNTGLSKHFYESIAAGKHVLVRFNVIYNHPSGLKNGDGSLFTVTNTPTYYHFYKNKMSSPIALNIGQVETEITCDINKLDNYIVFDDKYNVIEKHVPSSEDHTLILMAMLNGTLGFSSSESDEDSIPNTSPRTLPVIPESPPAVSFDLNATSSLTPLNQVATSVTESPSIPLSPMNGAKVIPSTQTHESVSFFSRSLRPLTKPYTFTVPSVVRPPSLKVIN